MIGQASTNVKKYIGYAFGILMTFLLVTELFSIETGDIGEIVVWLGASLVVCCSWIFKPKRRINIFKIGRHIIMPSLQNSLNGVQLNHVKN